MHSRMRTRLPVWTVLPTVVAVVLSLLVFGARPAHADVRADIKAKIAEAMSNYDNFEYDTARKLLTQALTLSKRNKLDGDNLTAQIHVAMGIVQYLGLQDEDAARLAFTDATSIDPSVQLDPAYRTPEMAALLDEARGPVDGGGGTEPTADCTEVTGVQHDVLMTAAAGKPLVLTALLGADTAATKLKISYRKKGQVDFRTVDMKSKDNCTFVGTIPADELRGDMLHYFIAAYDATGDALAQQGSEGVPNLVELTGTGGSGGGDTENPFGGNGETPPGGVTHGGKPPKVFVAIGIGSGIGYVTGKTEQAGNDVGCCVAPALLHLSPELGFGVSPQVAVSIVGRLGIPVGANIEGHATFSPAALVRMRYRLRTDGTGVHVNAAIGGGIMRNTIKLENEVGPGMDTDIVAIGPLLLGGGIGYGLPLGSMARFIADLNVTAGIPVVDKIGTSTVNFGAEIDASLGLQVGF